MSTIRGERLVPGATRTILFYNQHTDTENLRLGNLWNGIATLAAIMTAK